MNRLQTVSVLESAQACNFEPKYTAEEIAARRAKRAAAAVHTSASGPASDEDPPPPPPPDRMANNHWCTCGNCVPIDRPIQCRCCKEVANCSRLLEEDDITCITTHKDFSKVCLGKAVLRTALVTRLDCRGHRARLPEELDSESYRYCAYRMFTYWVHGILGKGNRRVIPACAVLRIRSTFPAGEGHAYVGYRELPDGELEEVPEELAI